MDKEMVDLDKILDNKELQRENLSENEKLKKELGVARGVSLGLGFGLLGVSLAWMIYEIYAFNVWSQANPRQNIQEYVKQRLGARNSGKQPENGRKKLQEAIDKERVDEVTSSARLAKHAGNHWKFPSSAAEIYQAAQDSDVVTFLFFGSPGCPACRHFTPYFEEAREFVAKHPQVGKLVRIWKISPKDYSEMIPGLNQSLLDVFNVKAVPTVLALSNGQIISYLQGGNKTSQEVVDFVEQNLRSSDSDGVPEMVPS